MSLIIGLLTFVLVITSLFLVLVVLMQRAKTDGGMGAAMGGSSMESAFGADTSNVLSGATIKASIVFFVVAFALYLAHIAQAKKVEAVDGALPTVPASALPAPTPQPVTVTPAPAPVETKNP
ncbi:preprotein translocase subunit SecG [Oleiharenicola lentus]|uniref:preprotein translocase subunit SecG n=1 Tax=Oleiharenicola lentus TaxID=2508720 RepID=UPI003F67EB7B